jgi:carbon monoxide dehydrogenase subunit G
VISVRRRVEINADIEELFDYLVEPPNIRDYVGPIHRIYGVSDAVIGEGTEVTVVASFLGIRFHQHTRCKVYKRPQKFVCESIGGRFHFEAGFTLIPTAEGTVLDGWGDASAPSLFHFAEPVLGRLVGRQADRDLAALKRRFSGRR